MAFINFNRFYKNISKMRPNFHISVMSKQSPGGRLRLQLDDGRFWLKGLALHVYTVAACITASLALYVDCVCTCRREAKPHRILP